MRVFWFLRYDIHQGIGNDEGGRGGGGGGVWEGGEGGGGGETFYSTLACVDCPNHRWK